MSQPLAAASVPCGRGPEECDGTAEAEYDGQAAYWKCTRADCGFEFGFRTVAEPEDGACGLGIPEAVRLQYSALQPPGSGSEQRSVFLGNVIRRRPE